jgi:hypothetical protein
MTPLHQPSAAEAPAVSETAFQPVDVGQTSVPEHQEAQPVIRAAATEFGTGLRSRLGADPNVCW